MFMFIGGLVSRAHLRACLAATLSMIYNGMPIMSALVPIQNRNMDRLLGSAGSMAGGIGGIGGMLGIAPQPSSPPPSPTTTVRCMTTTKRMKTQVVNTQEMAGCLRGVNGQSRCEAVAD